jgi:hypothetical protein
MDHLVFVDHASGELEKLLKGEKCMIVRAGMGRKTPYGRVKPGELLYFINNNGDGLVRAAAIVKSVSNTDLLTPEESRKLLLLKKNELHLEVEEFQEFLNKKYMVLVEVKNVCRVMEFKLDKAALQNAEDWVPIDNIDLLKRKNR